MIAVEQLKSHLLPDDVIMEWTCSTKLLKNTSHNQKEMKQNKSRCCRINVGKSLSALCYSSCIFLTQIYISLVFVWVSSYKAML